MSFEIRIVLFGTLFFVGMLGFYELGRWLGKRYAQKEITFGTRLFGTLDGAVFALLGLLIAFTFSTASQRFEERFRMVIEESNLISAAYGQLDLLPEADHAPMRELFRTYVDLRIHTYNKEVDAETMQADLQKTTVVFNEIWTRAVAGSKKMESPLAGNVLLPTLSSMHGIVVTRAAVMEIHTPWIIFVLLIVLGLMCALLGGYGTAESNNRDWLHALLFPIAISITVFVIMDLEYPRAGFLRVIDMDYIMVNLRNTMN